MNYDDIIPLRLRAIGHLTETVRIFRREQSGGNTAGWKHGIQHEICEVAKSHGENLGNWGELCHL